MNNTDLIENVLGLKSVVGLSAVFGLSFLSFNIFDIIKRIFGAIENLIGSIKELKKDIELIKLSTEKIVGSEKLISCVLQESFPDSAATCKIIISKENLI